MHGTYCREENTMCVFVRGQRRQSAQVIEAGCASLYSVESLGDHLQLHRDAEETGAQGFLDMY